jgi:hypothetical protein
MRVDQVKTSTQGSSSGVATEDDGAQGTGGGGRKGDGERGAAQYHCDYCQKDITSVVRIKCNECKVRVSVCSCSALLCFAMNLGC